MVLTENRLAQRQGFFVQSPCGRRVTEPVEVLGQVTGQLHGLRITMSQGFPGRRERLHMPRAGGGTVTGTTQVEGQRVGGQERVPVFWPQHLSTPLVGISVHDFRLAEPAHPAQDIGVPVRGVQHVRMVRAVECHPHIESSLGEIRSIRIPTTARQVAGQVQYGGAEGWLTTPNHMVEERVDMPGEFRVGGPGVGVVRIGWRDPGKQALRVVQDPSPLGIGQPVTNHCLGEPVQLECVVFHPGEPEPFDGTQQGRYGDDQFCIRLHHCRKDGLGEGFGCQEGRVAEHLGGRRVSLFQPVNRHGDRAEQPCGVVDWSVGKSPGDRFLEHRQVGIGTDPRGRQIGRGLTDGERQVPQRFGDSNGIAVRDMGDTALQ